MLISLFTFPNIIFTLATILIVGWTVRKQSRFYNVTKREISILENFFPAINTIYVKKIKIDGSLLTSNQTLKQYLQNPVEWTDVDTYYKQNGYDSHKNVYPVAILATSANTSVLFKEVLEKTNVYLCKNFESSADFELITNICERSFDSIRERIHSTLNAPLFFGLGGTFLSIFVGVLDLLANNGGLGSISGLLIPVCVAMCASALGLYLTVWNTFVHNKKAVIVACAAKDEYYDLIQRELMPTISNSMASTISSLKTVFSDFSRTLNVDLHSFAGSIGTLNENIRLEHQVLTEINKMNLSKTSKDMADAFKSLGQATEKLEVFKSYEVSLVSTMKSCEATLTKMQDAIREFKSVKDQFEDFSASLTVLTQKQETSTELQEQFRKSLETHFPSGSVGREIWMKQHDELLLSSKTLTKQLSEQLAQSTTYIQNFVNDNQQFFTAINKLSDSIKTVVTQQNKVYDDLQVQLKALREEDRRSQTRTTELHATMLEAIKQMTAAIRSMR